MLIHDTSAFSDCSWATLTLFWLLSLHIFTLLGAQAQGALQMIKVQDFTDSQPLCPQNVKQGY